MKLPLYLMSSIEHVQIDAAEADCHQIDLHGVFLEIDVLDDAGLIPKRPVAHRGSAPDLHYGFTAQDIHLTTDTSV